MRRREFITLLSGTTIIRPIAAWAQQREQIAQIGVLMSAGDDPEGQARITAFRQSLQKLGWTEGQNLRIDVRWTGGVPLNLTPIFLDALSTVTTSPFKASCA